MYLAKYSTFSKNFAKNRILNPCDFEKYSCSINTVGGNSLSETVTFNSYLLHKGLGGNRNYA